MDKIQFLTDQRKILRLLNQTDDFRKILIAGEDFPSSNYINISDELNKIQVPGSYLSEEEMYDVSLAIGTILSVTKFFNANSEDYPHLYQLSSHILCDASLHSNISGKFQNTGIFRDDASPELKKVRTEIHRQDQRLRKTIDAILKKSRESGLSPSDGQVSLRDGRLVIPVLSENKRRVKGVVQDESATGHTVFIEPTEVIEVNNEIRELYYQERRAIIKILISLSDLIRPSIPTLLKANQFLGTIDFIRAKAKFAVEIDAVLPEIASGDKHRIAMARHPLLFLFHQRIGKKVVPLDLELNAKERILVISGPNAGGKSVSLKTAGLLQFMLQCGLLLPVDESSKLVIFQKLFIDIGDEQSIENDLSTYSSHLRNLKHFLERADAKTLFLIDEFGTGTEPQFGGSIAEAILDELNSQKAYGIATTHYSNLKKLAEKTPGIINGAMKFDMDNMAPLYQLDIGKPGSSFALEIAQSIGLSKKITKKAKKLVGYSHVKFDTLVNQLESEKSKYEQKLKEISTKSNWLEREHKDYQDLKENLENERKLILKKAKEEAQHLVSNANKRIEQTIKEIKESKADKEKTKRAREQLRPQKVIEEPLKRTPAPKPVVPKEGDSVKISGQESIGHVVVVKGKKAEVMMGNIKSIVNLDKLERVDHTEGVSYNKSSRVQGVNYTKKAADFKSSLDVRGNRASEAVSKLDSFIDEAIILGINELRIIHGKGNGILRDVIRNYLRDYDHIKSIKDEHVDLGGPGVSVVTLS